MVRPAVTTDARLRALERTLLAMGNAMGNQGNDRPAQEVDYLGKVANRNPPTYNGTEDPAMLENWVRAFDKLLVATRCPEDQRVDIAAYYLTGDADLWWQHNKATLVDDAFNWEKMKEVLRVRFYPDHIQRAKQEEFIHLRMGSGTLQEYYTKFMELLRFAPDMVSTERAKAVKFEGGLTFSLQEGLGGVNFDSLQDVYARAANIYRVQQKRKASTDRNQDRQGAKKDNAPTRGNNDRPQRGNDQGRRHWCRRCQQNHPGKDCDGNLVKCHNCGKRGHRAYECRQRLANEGGQRAPPPQGGDRNRNGQREGQHGQNGPPRQAPANQNGGRPHNGAGRPENPPPIRRLNAMHPAGPEAEAEGQDIE